jgi:hypothetical protein
VLRPLARSKKHALLLLWCRTPLTLLVQKIASRVGRLLRVPTGTAPEPQREPWLSAFVDQLTQENVTSVLLVGAPENGRQTDAVLDAIRSAGCSIDAVPHDAADCVVVRTGALLGESVVDAASSARVLVVCDTESFHGYETVSNVLSLPEWELIGSHEHVWDACVVFRKIDVPQPRGAWEILDLLHRPEARQ